MRSFGGRRFKGEPIRIINDDKPAVCLQNGVFYACGTPFSGKTDKNENRKATDTRTLYTAIRRKKTNKNTEGITSGEALPLILPQTLFCGDEEETNLLLSFFRSFFTVCSGLQNGVYVWKKKALRRHIF